MKWYQKAIDAYLEQQSADVMKTSGAGALAISLPDAAREVPVRPPLPFRRLLAPFRERWRVVRAETYTLAARLAIWPMRRARPVILLSIFVAAHSAAAATQWGWYARSALRRMQSAHTRTAPVS